MSRATVLPAGEVVAGRYRVLRHVGRGGAGEVYAAEHVWTSRRVALKLLRAELVDSERAASRFLREARALSRLAHPNVVQVLDMGQDESDGALFLVQELLAGEDLRALLARRGTLTPEEAASIVLPITDALAHAHAAGIVHRDVTPANVFLHDEGGRVVPRLIDFGIARTLERDPASTLVTQQGVPVGTPMYMSPEQARGDVELDERTDVWSLGIVLFECVAGPPFDAVSAPMIYAKILTDGAPALRARAPDLPEALERVLQRALAHDRRDRYASMTELASSLREVVAPLDDAGSLRTSTVVHARPSVSKDTTLDGTAREIGSTARERGGAPQRTRSQWVSAGLALAGVAALATMGLWIGAPREPRAALTTGVTPPARESLGGGSAPVTSPSHEEERVAVSPPPTPTGLPELAHEPDTSSSPPPSGAPDEVASPRRPRRNTGRTASTSSGARRRAGVVAPSPAVPTTPPLRRPSLQPVEP